MNINMSAIMSKTKAFAESTEGKKRMEACLEKYKKEGRSSTAAGGKLITEETMYEAGDKMISVLRDMARNMDLPESVMKHFDSLDCLPPVRMPDGSYTMAIYFEDDLHRDSLMPDRYEGAHNIIAILNNGYSENKNMEKVWGVWHGARIHALTGRAGLQFMQQAVSDFNGNYSSDYGVVASVGDVYQ